MAQKKSTVEKLDASIGGKMQPQALELEEAVLGALMLEKEALTFVGDILSPDCFYHDAHQNIYAAILGLSNKEEPIDILTVIEELKRMNALEKSGGEAYVAQLTDRVASSAHIETHARIVKQKFIQRELIRASTEIQKNAYDESKDVSDLLDKAQQEIFKISEESIRQDVTHINQVIGETLERIEKIKDHEVGLRGVPSGFTKLDRLTSGWQNSDFIVVAGRPSMGKTAFALSMARNIAVDHKRPIAFFSLEMSSMQLVNRLISSETGLEQEKIRDGHLKQYEWEQIQVKIKDLVDSPIFIDDTPALSIYELRAKCRRLKIKYNIQAVIVDYLQLMNANVDIRRGGSRQEEVSIISRQLKIIAKELDIPVIALSQLNRGIELRKGDSKKPMLADLRESGAIEQDADLVLFIHRPEQYGITEDNDGNSLIGLADVIVAKHRNGATGGFQIRFKKEIARFMDLDDDELEGLPVLSDTPNLRLGSKMNDDKENFDNTGLTSDDFDDNLSKF